MEATPKTLCISIHLHTTDYRGDHGADVQIAHNKRDGESWDDFIGRLLINDEKCVDFIVIRRVKE